MISQVIFRIRQPKAYRPLTNDDIKWFKVDHTSATDISLRRPAPEVSVRSTCCIRQKTKKAEKMSIKFKPQYIYEEVLYEKNSEENCPKSLTLMLDKFCKSHNAVDEICLQEHGYKVLLGKTDKKHKAYLKSNDWYTLYGSYLCNQRNSLSHFFFSLWDTNIIFYRVNNPFIQSW